MSKSRNKKAKAKTKKPASRIVRVGGRRYNLDQPAAEWAQLLANPCNAKLAYPCYPTGSGSSVLVRQEFDAVVASGATETAIFGAFNPGGGYTVVSQTALVADNTQSLMLASGTLSIAGITSYASWRPVAACIQISWPGSELNRQGVVAVGIIPGGTAIVNMPGAQGGGNLTASAAQWRAALQHVERMPNSVVECKWFPGEADAVPIDAAAPIARYADDMRGRNVIGFSASGFPVSTGIRIRGVVVAEVSFVNINQVQAVVPPRSSTPTFEILRTMANVDPQWYLESAAKSVNRVSNAVSYAAQGVKAAGLAVNGLGLIMA